VPGQRIHIVMEPGLLAAVDKAKGIGESRGHFVRRVLEQALGDSSTAEQLRRASSPNPQVAGSTPARPASARASGLGKGTVTPRPKGG
jgi:hypothetical protein